MFGRRFLPTRRDRLANPAIAVARVLLHLLWHSLVVDLLHLRLAVTILCLLPLI
jgi:hypothetical protein